MGIVERRIQNNFDTVVIPEALQKYNVEGVLDNIAFEINWASFGPDRSSYESIHLVWDQPLVGIEEVCCDAIGRDAIRGNIKKIVLHHVTSDNAIKAEFKDGVLTGYMNFASGYSPGSTQFRTVLEDSL